MLPNRIQVFRIFGHSGRNTWIVRGKYEKNYDMNGDNRDNKIKY